MKDDVLIKSNKYGITIYFNSDNSFEELLDDVKNKFQSAAKLNQLPISKYFVSLRKILLQNKSIKNYWTKALKLSMKGTDSSIKVH